jgi:hypothetical protein
MERELHQGPQTTGGEEIYITIQVVTSDSD